MIELQKATQESDYPFRIYTEYGRIGKSPRKKVDIIIIKVQQPMNLITSFQQNVQKDI